MYGNITIRVEVESQEVVEQLEKEGYHIITTTEEAISFILKDSSESRLLYQEKENIKIFLEQGKFKDIPHDDFLEFLKKY